MKNIGVLALLVMATLLLAIAFPAVAAGPKTPGAPVPAVAAVPPAAAAAAVPDEKHPHIEEALEHMRAAKHELETAAHDFKGHRVKSLAHLQQAIDEAEICMKVDKD